MKRVSLAFGLAVAAAAVVTSAVLQQDGNAAPTTGLAPHRLVEAVHHYEVKGTSLDAVRREVFERGPYDSTKGRRFAGWTEWRIRWWFHHKRVAAGCAVERAMTETLVSYTLPRWADEEQAPREHQEAWSRFSSALTEHEKGHGRIAVELAARVEAAVEALPPAPSCARLEQQANALAYRLITEDREQEAYDLRTGHGATQGAAFPRVLVSAP